MSVPDLPSRRVALFSVAALSVLVLVCGLAGGSPALAPVAGWLFTAAVASLPVALIAFAVNRRDARRLGPWLVALLVLLVGGLLTAVALSGLPGGGPRWAGLPVATVVFVLGVGLGSVLLVGLAYGWTFRQRERGDDA